MAKTQTSTNTSRHGQVATAFCAAAALLAGCASGTASSLAMGPQASSEAPAEQQGEQAAGEASRVLAVSGNTVLPIYQLPASLEALGGLGTGALGVSVQADAGALVGADGPITATVSTAAGTTATAALGGAGSGGTLASPSAVISPSLGGSVLGPTPGATPLGSTTGTVTATSSGVVTGAVATAGGLKCKGLPVC